MLAKDSAHKCSVPLSSLENSEKGLTIIDSHSRERLTIKQSHVRGQIAKQITPCLLPILMVSVFQTP